MNKPFFYISVLLAPVLNFCSELNESNIESSSSIYKEQREEVEPLLNSSIDNQEVVIKIANPLLQYIEAHCREEEVDYENRTLKDHCFTDNLDNVDFSGWTLLDVSFINVDLTETLFEGANLEKIKFSQAILGNDFSFDFDYSDNDYELLLMYSKLIVNDKSPNRAKGLNKILVALPLRLDKKDLRNLKLIGIKLRNANLSGALLENSDLSDADLTGAIMKSVDLKKADLSRAVLKHANLSLANLSKANLSETNFKYALLEGTNLRNAILLRTNFFNASLNYCEIDKSQFKHCNMNKSSYNNNWIKKHLWLISTVSIGVPVTVLYATAGIHAQLSVNYIIIGSGSLGSILLFSLGSEMYKLRDLFWN